MIGLLLDAIVYLLSIYESIIIIGALISWLPIDRNNKFFDYLNMITEPALNPIRNFMNKSAIFQSLSMFDLSPLILIMLIEFVKNILTKISYMF